MPGTATHASGASSSNVSESYMRLPHDRQQHAPGPGHAGGGSVARGGALDKPAGGIPPQHASALAAAYGSPVASDPIAAPANTRLPRGSGHSIAAVSRQAAAVQNSPPADLADLGLNEDSAVLAPIAIQEEEPVRSHRCGLHAGSLRKFRAASGQAWSACLHLSSAAVVAHRSSKRPSTCIISSTHASLLHRPRSTMPSHDPCLWAPCVCLALRCHFGNWLQCSAW